MNVVGAGLAGFQADCDILRLSNLREGEGVATSTLRCNEWANVLSNRGVAIGLGANVICVFGSSTSVVLAASLLATITVDAEVEAASDASPAP